MKLYGIVQQFNVIVDRFKRKKEKGKSQKEDRESEEEEEASATSQTKVVKRVFFAFNSNFKHKDLQ